jgi:hypothetical protein
MSTKETLPTMTDGEVIAKLRSFSHIDVPSEQAITLITSLRTRLDAAEKELAAEKVVCASLCDIAIDQGKIIEAQQKANAELMKAFVYNFGHFTDNPKAKDGDIYSDTTYGQIRHFHAAIAKGTQ